MDLVTRERDRLLQRTARVYGLSFTLVAALCALVPGAFDGASFAVTLLLLAVLAICQSQFAGRFGVGWAIASIVVGLGLVVSIVLVSDASPTPAAVTAILQVTAGSLSSVALVLTSTNGRLVVLTVSFAAVAATTIAVTLDVRQPIETGALILLGWSVSTLIGIWIRLAVPRAARRIASIGRAHRAERNASELEAQRRQGARLLHDTVLATLTLLAHSGRGVGADTLRAQAGDDAALLRQLRLGINPSPTPAPGLMATPVEETALGRTLESVKSRFSRMGLEVSWHGTGRVLLPSEVLDAFLLALAECLENVRRHAGVNEAHVTITEDETTVRAMVTDSGAGFDLGEVPDTKLGFKDSVVGRLTEIGGSARLFSAPGNGTTVVLEVPR